MNGTRASAGELARQVAAGQVPPGVALAVAPPYPFLDVVSDRLRGSPVELAAQDCSGEKDGAFTGDVSAEMLASVGVARVIVGHSERRTLRGEGDELVAR